MRRAHPSPHPCEAGEEVEGEEGDVEEEDDAGEEVEDEEGDDEDDDDALLDADCIEEAWKRVTT